MDAHFFAQWLSWGQGLHRAVVALYLVGLVWPLLEGRWRRWTKGREVPQLRAWVCQACGTLNTVPNVQCRRCLENRGDLRFWERGRLKTTLDHLKGVRRAGQLVWRGLGWTAFYGLSLWVFIAFNLHSFHLAPLEEFLASLSFMWFLLGWLYVGLGLGLGRGIHLSRLTHLFVAVFFAGLFLGTGFLWVLAARATPQEAGVLLQQNAAPGAPRHTKVKTQYATLSWPVFGLRKQMVTRLDGRWVGRPLERWPMDGAAQVLTRDIYFLPRWVYLEQTLTVPAAGPYRVRPASDGLGLVVEALPKPR